MNKVDEWIDLAIKDIQPFCTPVELEGLQTRLSSKCEKEFSRGISELVVSMFYAKNYPQNLLLPRGNKKDKDIDVSFLVADQRVNIEVKCPDLSYAQSKKFTLHVPYMHADLKKGKELERNMKNMMSNDLNVVPNKVLNFKDFLIDCSEKFRESAKEGDFNVALFSMLELDWMDDYRIKIEDECLLAEFELIHAVVISNAAYCHKRKNKKFIGDFQKCFNYVLPNQKHISRFTPGTYRSMLSAIPNHSLFDDFECQILNLFV